MTSSTTKKFHSTLMFSGEMKPAPYVRSGSESALATAGCDFHLICTCFPMVRLDDYSFIVSTCCMCLTSSIMFVLPKETCCKDAAVLTNLLFCVQSQKTGVILYNSPCWGSQTILILYCRYLWFAHDHLVGGFEYVFIFTPKIGEINPFWWAYFSVGWFNHQPVMHCLDWCMTNDHLGHIQFSTFATHRLQTLKQYNGESQWGCPRGILWGSKKNTPANIQKITWKANLTLAFWNM